MQGLTTRRNGARTLLTKETKKLMEVLIRSWGPASRWTQLYWQHLILGGSSGTAPEVGEVHFNSVCDLCIKPQFWLWEDIPPFPGTPGPCPASLSSSLGAPLGTWWGSKVSLEPSQLNNKLSLCVFRGASPGPLLESLQKVPHPFSFEVSRPEHSTLCMQMGQDIPQRQKIVYFICSFIIIQCAASKNTLATLMH